MPAFAYLDHNATSPIRPAVLDAMVEALRAGGNPSSVHRAGRAARTRIDAARRQVAALVGALPSEIVFTSGGTEANNMALAGTGRKRVLVSAVEHESVLKAVPGADVIPVDRNGVVDLAALERMLAGSEPALVSVMFANNETGVIQPVAEVVRLARAADALVHCDAVQAAGKAARRPAWSRRRLSQPVGAQARRADRRWRPGGARRRALRLRPQGRRPGIQSSRRHRERRRHRRLRRSGRGLARRAGHGLAARPGRSRAAGDRAPAKIYGAAVPRLANTTCISMPGVKAETQVMALDLAGVCVSAGAACSSGKVTRSAVLSAMGVEPAEAETAIRISCGWNTVSEDIDCLIAAWKGLYIRVTHSDLSQARAA